MKVQPGLQAEPGSSAHTCLSPPPGGRRKEERGESQAHPLAVLTLDLQPDK